MRVVVSGSIKRTPQVFKGLIEQRRNIINDNEDTQDSSYILQGDGHEVKKKHKSICSSGPKAREAKDQRIIQLNIMVSEVDGIKYSLLP